MSLLTAVNAQALKNPDRIKQWSLRYFYRTQSKTIFDETFTGTTMALSGPKKSNTVVGSPILQVTDLKDKNGMVVNYKMIDPLFTDSESRLNYIKVRGETREGSEKGLSKKFIKFPIAEGFWGVKEEDVNPGKKDIGMSDLAKLLTKSLSDNNVQYLDDDTLEGGFQMGHSRHLYTTVAKAAGAADGAALETFETAVKDYGIQDLPEEHPNTYVYAGGKLNRSSAEAGTTFVDKVNAGIAKITTADTPGLELLNAISLEIKKQKLIGIQFISKKLNATLFKVLVDPIMMTQLKQEFKSDGGGLGNILSNAYMTKGNEHPLIRQGNLLFGNLLICEEERLLEGAFSNKYSFSARAQGGDAGTRMTIAKVAANGNTDIHLTKAGRAVDVATAVTNSIFAGNGTAAATATSDELDGIATVYVLGANSIGRVPGPVRPLIPRVTTDYERIVGLGTTNIFGHKRIDFVNADGSGVYNQSSMSIRVWRGY